MTNEEILAVFLKKHRKYKSFRSQLRERLEYETNHVTVLTVISDGLYWCNTVEGSEYWLKLYYKWSDLSRKFKLKDTIDLTKV